MPGVDWFEIHGFSTLDEYQRFLRYLADQIEAGLVSEVEADPSYVRGCICGGRWFVYHETGEKWRLVEPDIPFTGLWEPVID